MLCLTRKRNESITIEVPGTAPITVTVLDYERGRIRLGVEADENVLICRTESWLERAGRVLTSKLFGQLKENTPQPELRIA